MQTSRAANQTTLEQFTVPAATISSPSKYHTANTITRPGLLIANAPFSSGIQYPTQVSVFENQTHRPSYPIIPSNTIFFVPGIYGAAIPSSGPGYPTFHPIVSAPNGFNNLSSNFPNNNIYPRPPDVGQIPACQASNDVARPLSPNTRARIEKNKQEAQARRLAMQRVSENTVPATATAASVQNPSGGYNRPYEAMGSNQGSSMNMTSDPAHNSMSTFVTGKGSVVSVSNDCFLKTGYIFNAPDNRTARWQVNETVTSITHVHTTFSVNDVNNTSTNDNVIPLGPQNSTHSRQYPRSVD